MTASALRPPTVVLPRGPAKAASGREPSELVGEMLLDRYRVERLIGEGGMAIVYAGTHTAIDRTVAIKVLRRRYADEPDTVQRFLREARASSVVRHEHVVEVTDFGTTDDGLVFMVMEYLEGDTLAEVLQREGRMPWPRVHGIALQICEALQAAHEAGVVHRDITLRNCLRIRRRSNREYIKILDFGIAKLLAPMQPGVAPADPRRLTSDMDVFGTPEFMSPEQAKRSIDADPRSDIYATGVLLYALLTGRLPFEAGSAAEVMARHIYDEVPPPSRHEPTLPAGVEAVVLRALQKDPNRRFQSMAELGAAIQAIPRDAAGEPAAPAAVSWSSPSIAGTTGLLQRRATRSATGMVLGGLVILGALAFGLRGWLGAEEGPTTTIRAGLLGGGSPDPKPLPKPPAEPLAKPRAEPTANSVVPAAKPFLPSVAPRLSPARTHRVATKESGRAAPARTRATKPSAEPRSPTLVGSSRAALPTTHADERVNDGEHVDAGFRRIDEVKDPFETGRRE